MRISAFVGIGAAVLAFTALAATPAAAACCDAEKKACCDAKKACCDTQSMTCCDSVNDAAARAVLLPQVVPETPLVRETLAVQFNKPVKVGDRILFGSYIIEHDHDRMAQGKPCTHIYAASDPRIPVVAFHCTHLDRAEADRNSVTLRSLGESNGMRELTEFQFAGERGAHGTPGVR
jgi:hypothetical protein